MILEKNAFDCVISEDRRVSYKPGQNTTGYTMSYVGPYFIIQSGLVRYNQIREDTTLLSNSN